MRPLKLTLQAFGAFSDKIEINFESLGKSNIYLICGATGSGKTTIFDAICYALFNSASGTTREKQPLRSHFAQDGLQTFVELEFELNNEKYKIFRSASYKREKLRGKGTTKEDASAILYLPDGKILGKAGEADEFLPKILGFNLAQFSQIALLAQGEFLKLLNCDTKTRSEIFRNIFKTWNYADFQEDLKNKSNELKNKYETSRNSILQYINDIVTSNETLKELKERYSKGKCFDNLEYFLSTLNKQNKEDDKQLKNIKKDISKIENEIKLIQEKIRNINLKNDIKSQIKELDVQIETSKKEFGEIENKFKNISNNKNELKILNLELQKTQESYNKSLEIKDIRINLLKLEDKLSILKTEKLDLNNSLSETQCNYLKSLITKFLTTEENLKDTQKLFLNKQKEVNKHTQDYTDKYNEYLSLQAGIIAKTLKTGEPCPVCGSKEHPNIAKTSNNNLTKELLDELKEKLDNENDALQKLSLQCSTLIEKNKFEKNEYDKSKRKFNIELEEKKYEVLNINFEDELIEIQKQIEELEKNIIDISGEIKENNAKEETLLKDIKIKDICQIQEKHKNLAEKINLKENEIKEIEQNYLAANIELNNKLSKVELLNKQLKELEKINAEELSSIIETNKKLIDEIQNFNILIEELVLRKGINDRIYSLITVQDKEFNAITQQYSNFKLLSECANGVLAGSTKISFEQYIQGYYLDLVLYEANKRLKIMTQNQFQLFRKTDDLAHNTKTGLELEVMDYHTFKKRSTKTLSGGESFKAALSLALGLSDCISNFSGAINIETMFIDEGFGSLDSESLELAMDVIFNLSTNNRVIGIISHIDDLKNKIQNQILTYKTQQGSKIEVKF